MDYEMPNSKDSDIEDELKLALNLVEKYPGRSWWFLLLIAAIGGGLVFLGTQNYYLAAFGGFISFLIIYAAGDVISNMHTVKTIILQLKIQELMTRYEGNPKTLKAIIAVESTMREHNLK